tara:strand:+ start:58 stop:435 length:378 start_codon:yes stop_codon:yes gene_type:complete
MAKVRTSLPLHATEYNKPDRPKVVHARKVKSKSTTKTPDKITTTKKKLVRSGRAYSRKVWGKDYKKHMGAFKEKTKTKEYKKLRDGKYSKKTTGKSKTVVSGPREDRRYRKNEPYITTKKKSTTR